MARQDGGTRARAHGAPWARVALWAAVLLLAALLRIPGATPASAPRHPDEYNFVFWPLLILLGHPTPPVFYYPHLHYYLLAAANAVDLTFTPGPGGFEAAAIARYFWYPDRALALGRAIGVLCAVATVGAVGLLARRALGRGLPAAAVLAVCVVHVRQSPLAGADVPMTLLFVLAVWAAARLEDAPDARSYLLAGALVGMAAAAKYHGALAGAAVPVVHLALLRPLADRRLLLAGLAAVALFLAATPAAWLESDTFRAGFGQLWHRVAPGGVGAASASAAGWRQLSLALWTGLGPPGVALCLAGLVLALRRRRPAELAVAAVFLLYLAILGSASLAYVRYALPLTALGAVLAGLAVERAGRPDPRRAAVLLVLALAPPLYGSVRVADMRSRPDTRAEAAAWMEGHLPPGTVICNFGGWAGDPPARTIEEVWWGISQLLAADGAPSVAQALDDLAGQPPPGAFVSYAVQTANEHLARGSMAAVEALGCDCAVVHRHPLGFSAVDPGFLVELAEGGRLRARWAPAGGLAEAARYDDYDALYVPLSGSGDQRQAGPVVEVWQLAEPAAVAPAPWTARDLFARALVRGAGYLADQGESATALHLVKQGLSAAPASRDARLFGQAALVFRRLGLDEAAAASRARAATLNAAP